MERPGVDSLQAQFALEEARIDVGAARQAVFVAWIAEVDEQT